MNYKRPSIIGLLLMLNSVPSSAGDLVFRCTSPEGVKTFSSTPCSTKAEKLEYKGNNSPKALPDTAPRRQGDILNEMKKSEIEAAKDTNSIIEKLQQP